MTKNADQYLGLLISSSGMWLNISWNDTCTKINVGQLILIWVISKTKFLYVINFVKEKI